MTSTPQGPGAPGPGVPGPGAGAPGEPVAPARPGIAAAAVLRWRRLRAALTDAGSFRGWMIDANDGIIATASLLQGFAGAGASDRLLLFAATAATIAGGLSAGGAKWAEVAAEREAEQRLVREESAELDADLHGEIDELAAHWQGKGLTPGRSRPVLSPAGRARGGFPTRPQAVIQTADAAPAGSSTVAPPSTRTVPSPAAVTWCPTSMPAPSKARSSAGSRSLTRSTRPL